jgi:excinuclease ABC subunit C
LLEELGKLLGIETPLRIELFDNSHLQGSSPVGAMVCYINGEPAKGMYRKFHLDEKDAGDDFHSMKEITYRRYKRLKDEALPNPDLILVDGGLTQVHATQEALDAVGTKINLFGLFQERQARNRRLNRRKWQDVSDSITAVPALLFTHADAG